MRLARHRVPESTVLTLGRFRIVQDDPMMSVMLSRSGVLTLRACGILSVLGPGILAVWAASAATSPGTPVALAYCAVAGSFLVLISRLDFGFAPLVFDRRTERVERRGKAVGHWSDVLSIRVVNRPLESGDDFYAVLLVMSGDKPDRLELIELGESRERADVLAYATRIADFLGVRAEEGGEPRLTAKWMQTTGQCEHWNGER